VAKIWRAGCIIQARFLTQIADAYTADPALPLLLASPIFRDALTRAGGAWRAVIAEAVSRGIPTPAFSSSLAYYDQIRRDRLPAALIQAQRDFFGSHTYRRVDKPGVFHTLWSGDRSEERLSD
jgi:6-phosphogluconate dehydrogenase